MATLKSEIDLQPSGENLLKITADLQDLLHQKVAGPA